MRPRVKVKSHTPILGGRFIMTEQDRSTFAPNNGITYRSCFIPQDTAPVLLNTVLTAAKQGVPVPTRIWFKAAGIDYDKFVEEFNGKD